MVGRLDRDAVLHLTLEMDVYNVLFKKNKVELCLPEENQKLIDNVQEDVIASQVLKYEYLTLLSLKEPEHKKSKERIEKYLVSIADASKKPWALAMNSELVPAVKKFLGHELTVTDAISLGAEAPCAVTKEVKDKKEKKQTKEKKEKKGDKKDNDLPAELFPQDSSNVSPADGQPRADQESAKKKKETKDKKDKKEKKEKKEKMMFA